MNKYKFLHDNFTKYGYKIFPIVNNSKEPLIDRWQLDASCDSGQLVYWLEHGNNPNFALPAYANNLFIIDIDMHGDVDGVSSFRKLLDDLGIDKIDTLRQKTPGGGIHLIFKSDEDLNCVRNSSNTFDDYPGIDIRTKGYILIEPSEIDGKPYKLSGGVEQINTMPDELKKFILSCNKTQTKTTSNRSDFYQKGKVVGKGYRDDEIFTYLNYLYDNTKLGYDEISLLAHTYNEECFNPPLKRNVIDYKIEKLFERDRKNMVIIKF